MMAITIRSSISGRGLAFYPTLAHQRLRVPDQLIEERAQPPGQLRVAQAAFPVERLFDTGDRERGRDRDTPHGQADQSQLGQAIETAESAR
jgi:hypothetical protein